MSTPPRMIKACTASSAALPAASSAWKAEVERRAISAERRTMSTYTQATSAANTRPNSLIRAEKIKSVRNSGITLALPSPRPVPHQPPLAMAISDCTIW